MDITTVFSAIEASQTARANVTGQLSNDQAKAAAIALAIATDTTNVTDATGKADADVLSGISFLQALLSTAVVVPPVVPPAV
jgi:hypothetical protein